ncbi:MAG: hypothetical protein AAFU85_32390 [Planctomycetota bacterium]
MSDPAPNNDAGLIRPPQEANLSQALSVVESSRVVAEIQAALTVAKASPRDEVRALDAIKTSCQRQRLAEQAEYSYAKGGSDIKGPSIRLLETCARHWGNLDFGFRELSQGDGESTVMAFAWDLQTNTRCVRQITVPHSMMARGRVKKLTDPRDVYEHVANMAQRRVRACLENVIPRDVWEEAVDECRNTLVSKVDLSGDAVPKMVKAFEDDFDVTREQIVKRIQRNLESITPAQFLRMRGIYNSLKQAMSEPTDWFEFEDEPSEVGVTEPSAEEMTASLKTKKRGAAKPRKASKEEAKTEPAPDATTPWAEQEARLMAALDGEDQQAISEAWGEFETACSDVPTVKRAGQVMNERLKEIQGAN